MYKQDENRKKKNNFKHCFVAVGRHNMWICWSWWEFIENGCSVFQLSYLDDLNWFGGVMVGLAFSYNIPYPRYLF